MTEPMASTTCPTGIVRFYPSVGRLNPTGDHWQIAVHGHVLTPRPDNLRRAFITRLVQRAAKFNDAQMKDPNFVERINDFLMLGLKDRHIAPVIAERIYPLKKSSKKSGLFSGSVRVPRSELRDIGNQGWLQFANRFGGENDLDGRVQLIAPTGPSVISDIDDTLKVTQVSDRAALLSNTFLKPFRPIDGMAEKYRTWGLSGAVFHYVSASPWQLYRPLADFMETAGFPDGSFNLRSVRLQGTGTLRLLMSNKRGKKKSIRNLLRWFPFRRFVLVGDSGESDPEIYGWAARRYPNQIQQVCIRRLGKIKGKRLRRAFRGIPKSVWRVFDDAEELDDLRCIAEAGWQV